MRARQFVSSREIGFPLASTAAPIVAGSYCRAYVCRNTCVSWKRGAKPPQKNSLSLMIGPPSSTPMLVSKSGLRTYPSEPPTVVIEFGLADSQYGDQKPNALP